jgi:hypothetical protein
MAMFKKGFKEDRKSNTEQNNETVKGIEKVMDKYFTGMKDNVKIMKEFESSGTEEESASAMKKLRPDALLKFKDILS